MDSLLIKGSVPLRGEVTISGAKNAVLPIMAATLLTTEPCVIRRVPRLSDVQFMGQILTWLGAQVRSEGDTLRIQARKIQGAGDYDLIRKMRGSICVMGPLLGRLKQASVSLPGGCVIGARPINLHLKGFEALGARVTIEGGYVHARAKRLAGATMFLGGRAGSTVLGTANVMMAAVLAEGVTIIESAACEPEIVDLARFLTAMGAQISGAGSPTLTITGVKQLHGAEHEVIPDRIEAATYAIAAAATHGEVTLRGARAEHLRAVLDKLADAGVGIERRGADLTIRRPGRLKPVDITTLPYAGFPTDVQAQMMALMALTPGISIITERIFESRFMHVSELARLGADIEIEGPSAIVKGGKPLSGAPVMASDLRASAALVIAGLAARGTTQINRIYHLDRGYENIDGKLRQLGARIERIEES
ncbi:MAG TPA: UDP-N-acetylglucosamine 1-carboxyvinyltransferase [Verrucomicrobiota bacterium]|jgi:UDP-N-acetylglucosamine 1-carboxyvinyltransferase|nr:UDP-N-acetylglucosamine 1-carboxyvinyltransferase [Verrucomicrobiota bacterium]OQC25139.1 MAG: UDP-N-acetylglucosamine 1-carboxyvinyltransferase 1 [Verrucomicrobia bacterium ADurb.Bin063]HCL92403.1 UDP-N-acetylglucosamine 1-carboxyvinyltransferase [Limisphaerales bacterium]HRR64041.1 UDP-N-acetylglucosamine 1-carboxyvinyltransferase [Candidatus Paceibacterota bacterium]MBP8015541.1 UDP-N-acetylglucosamine 1-carboxyvinyltransferase [Verrucomicrobiota bacterium]